MSYPPPAGLKASQTSSQSSSLPPRPPPPANPQAFSTNNSRSAFSAFTGFAPRSVAAQSQSYRTDSPHIAAGPSAPPSNFTASTTSYTSPQYQQSAGPSFFPQDNNYDDSYTQQTPPQIRNPFVAPAQIAAASRAGFGAGVDPELEAQIAQWQSAYSSRDDKRPGASSATGANTGPLGVRSSDPAMTASEITSAANPDTGVASVVTGADGKQKTVIRKGGGQTWQDPTLLEWDPAHFRLFVGNLAGEVTDESLLKAFAKYDSVQKARVIRDKRTTKSRGFGFVSFSDGDEYFRAAKEMQGKYIGSHPVLLRKSTTEIKATTPRDQRKGKHGKGGAGGGGGGTGAGVQKKQSKMRNGMKIIG